MNDQKSNHDPLEEALKKAKKDGNSKDLEALKAELEDSQKKLAEAEEKLQKMTEVAQHALADLQNFRRRSEEEKAQFVTFANADLLNAIIPAIDNCFRALAHEPKDETWATGVESSIKQLWQSLEQKGLKQIPTVGETYDPKLHEALLTGPGPKDQVIAELEKGYLLGDKVIKPARVSVGTGE